MLWFVYTLHRCPHKFHQPFVHGELERPLACFAIGVTIVPANHDSLMMRCYVLLKLHRPLSIERPQLLLHPLECIISVESQRGNIVTALQIRKTPLDADTIGFIVVPKWSLEWPFWLNIGVEVFESLFSLHRNILAQIYSVAIPPIILSFSLDK